MELQLALKTVQSQQNAKDIYQDGAFSKSVAQVTLDTALTTTLDKGATVIGTGPVGEIRGKLYATYGSGISVIQIQYETNENQQLYVGCQVGANPDPNLDGCYDAVGSLTITGLTTPVTYEYTPVEHNTNKRSIQGFSTSAEDKMSLCEKCPYDTFDKFFQYYGQHDYADQWVMAAFNGENTAFSNGNADFGVYSIVGRIEAIKKGTAYMNVWMYVIREMEDALDDCKEECTIENCNDDPVHAWDEAVAFYTGSLESTDGSGSGKLIYNLADKRGANFNTCGDLANEDSGTSHVNIEIFRQFEDGLRQLLQGECAAVRANKERIEQLMAVPLVQGVLRYAYQIDVESNDEEEAEAEGAVFAAAVLPIVHACDEDDAEIIYQNMKVNAGGADFSAVRAAFERNYACMGIRCEDVGGYYDSPNSKYREGAAPCGSSGSSLGATISLVVAFSVCMASMFL
jgi:hypothetical protein